MIKKLTFTNYSGESLDLTMGSPEQSGFFIKSIEGLGPTKANINISESLYMDGGYFNSARGTSRNIVLNLGFYDNGSTSMEDLRLKTYKYFPTKQKLTIRIETDNRVAYTDGYVESNEVDIFSKEESTVISIVCPEAALYGETTITTLFSGTDPLFEFPFENPSLTEPLIEFGNIVNATIKSVIYDGDEETGVVISMYMTGNVGNINVYNNTTAQKMVLSGAKIQDVVGSYPVAGDTITISTVKNKKYITLRRGATTYNILGALSNDSTWIKLVKGDNLFVYTASLGVANIQFSVTHNRLYGGI